MGLTAAAEMFVKQYAEFLAGDSSYPNEKTGLRGISASLAVDLAYAVKVGFDMGRRLEIERAEAARAQAENEWIVRYHGGSVDYNY